MKTFKELREGNKFEYIIWGVPKGERNEQILFTKAKSSGEAKKIMKILKDKHGVSKIRLQTLDLSKELTGKDFTGALKSEKRDYKDEYKKFQSSPERIKYRAELVKYNRDKGTYGNRDKKDASHKGGKIVGFEDQSKNRGRSEASRLKKVK